MTFDSCLNIRPVPGETYSMVYGLLPCPFCGDNNQLLKTQNDGKNCYYYLSCRLHSCLLGRTRAHRSKDKLFRTWNNRISKATPAVQTYKPEPAFSPLQSFALWFREFFLGK